MCTCTVTGPPSVSTDVVTATSPGTAEPLAETDSRVGAPAARVVVLWAAVVTRTLVERGIVLPSGGWDRTIAVGVPAGAAVIRAVAVAVVVDVIVTVAVILEMDTTGATTTGATEIDVGLLLGAAAAQKAGAVAVVPDLKPLTRTMTAAAVRTAKPVSSAGRLILAATAGAGVLAGTNGVARRKGFGRSPTGRWVLSDCSAVSSGPTGSAPQGTSSLSSALTGSPTRRFPDRCRCRGRHVGGTGR